MCFSATASFVASGGLAAAGAASWKQAKKKHRLLAAVPLLFAAQQALEGIQWLILRQNPAGNLAVGYAFLFFAFLFWPVYVPVMIFFLDKKQQRLHRWFIFFGSVVSLFLLTILLTQPLTILVGDHHIMYQVFIPFERLVFAVYIAVTCGAPLMSSIPFVRLCGALVLIFAVLSLVFYFNAFASVWCFFAAVLSALIYFFVALKYGRR